MNTFKELLLNTKRVSVWGVGYLGYTTILRLQENGFCSVVYDFNEDRLDDLKNNLYPEKEQINSWSKRGKIPAINLEKISIVQDKNLLFKNKIHIVSFPNSDGFGYSALADLFIKNKNELENSLILFQSAGAPKTIENNFCNSLIKNNLDVEIATVFRSDWTIEDFFNKNVQRVVSGNNQKAIDKTDFFLQLLGLESIKLGKLEEAELYENVKNALSYTTVAFFNQLSLSYPHINMNELSKKLLHEMHFDNLTLGVSSVDYKSEQSIENILRGSTGDFLSILKEANSTNISFLFYYVNLLKNKHVTSVTILGLSSYNSMGDLRFSPSVMLAEYLNKENIKVYIHDENFSQEELQKILPYSEFIDLNTESISSDVVFVMSLSQKYRFFTQNEMDTIGLSKVRYVLDNTGFFKHFKYSDKTLYHQLCDENLVKVMN
ncbi:MAG: hypothetical protein NTW78_10815 [Campylobacterales bacterium]|nr:hypothetical protein [Campylobacterales bacterium]